MKATRLLAALGAIALAPAAAGCGGSSTVQPPTVAPAAVYKIVHFKPAGPVQAGKPVRISFEIEQPNGDAADPVQDRPRPAHRRPPDPRPRRPRLHHPPAPAGRRPRHDREDGRLPGARPLPARRRRLPGLERPGGQRQLPALRLDAGHRGLQAEAAAAALELADDRRLPLHPPRRGRPEGDRPGARHRRRRRPRRHAARPSRPGSARSRTRSSSARTASTTSTPTSARPGSAAARASSGRPR